MRALFYISYYFFIVLFIPSLLFIVLLQYNTPVCGTNKGNSDSDFDSENILKLPFQRVVV